MNCKDVLFVIGIVLFILILMEKWKLREWLIINSPHKLITKALSCDFCMIFHISWIVSLLVYFFGINIVFLPCVITGLIYLLYEKNSN